MSSIKLCISLVYTSGMTIKQDKAIAELVENGGNVSKAMRQAGYSPATAKTPQKLTQSKAYKQKIEQLAKANNVTIEQYMMNLGLGMTATKQNQFTGEITEDIQTRLRANQQAEKFIGLDHPTQTKDEMIDIPSDADELTITQAVFKKHPPHHA